MLEITTNRDKNRKKILLDGYTYMVRRPGAGESLDLTQFGKEVDAMDKRELSDAEQKDFQEKSIKMLSIVLGFFDDLGNKEAAASLQSIDPEELMMVVKQVFEDQVS